MIWKVPYFDLRLGDEEKQAVMDVLDSNWLTTGPRTEQFEKDFANALDVEASTAIAVTNCTAALHLAVIALGIGPEDEVICPSLTFVATANAIRYAGATPVFADVCSPSDWSIDPADIERKITSKTKAIIVVHYGGYTCHMDQIMAIAERHGLKVIEDAAHALVSEWQGRKLGTIGDAGCFSFFSNKNMTTGEGGMIVARDPEVATRMRVMRSHGMSKSSYERFKSHVFGYDVTELGFNFRIDEIRSALGIVQLKALPEKNILREKIISRYRKLLQEQVPDVTSPFSDHPGKSAYHVFPILLPKNGPDRATVMESMEADGVQTSIHYHPIHHFQAFEGYSADVPVTEGIAPRIVSLPLYPNLSDESIAHVVQSVRKALKP